jgi:hypothetical protein
MSCAWVLTVMGVQARAEGVTELSRTLPPSTWVALSPLPNQGPSAAIIALGVNPFDNQVVLAGRSDGALMRSADGGSTWKVAHGAGPQIKTIAFSPSKTGFVLAGLRSGGALASQDGGVSWGPVSGLDGRSVLAFGFALTLVLAGTDRGVYATADGLTWRPSGLSTTSIGALTVSAIHDPVRVVAGSNLTSRSGVPLFQSTDGGVTWVTIKTGISGKYVTSLAAGPLPPASTSRPLVVGTNSGLFTSVDKGVTFRPISGGNLLPSTDYTQIVFVTTHFDRFYAASDGSASASGGLWRTRDAAKHFPSLAPPMPSVTALAVSNEETPILYVATLRPADQGAFLWAYRDTGAPPQGVPTTPTPSASGSRTNPPPAAGTSGISELLLSGRTPYIALGLVALIVILMAVISHFRGRRG